MDNAFKFLLDTSSLWLPAVMWGVGQLSATRPGRKIEGVLKARLKWLKDPEAEKAFHEAFRDGIERYEREHGQSEAARAVAQVLRHIAEHDTYRLDRAMILHEIFADRPDAKVLADVVKRTVFALEGAIVSADEVTLALQDLIVHYLRPAFRAQRYFTESVGLAEIIGLLKDLIVAVQEPQADLEPLRQDYAGKLAEKHEFITMQVSLA